MPHFQGTEGLLIIQVEGTQNQDKFFDFLDQNNIESEQISGKHFQIAELDLPVGKHDDNFRFLKSIGTIFRA